MPCLPAYPLNFIYVHSELTNAEGRDSMLDLSAEQLRISINELGRVTGKVGVEEILDVVFKDFCIGK